MTYFDKATDLINNQGYGIGVEKFTNGVIRYSLMKNLSKSERIIHFEMARNIASLLIKKGAKIIFRRNDIKALNFTPERIPSNCVRYFTE